MALHLFGKWCERGRCHHQWALAECSAAAGRWAFLLHVWTAKINGKSLCACNCLLGRPFFLSVFCLFGFYFLKGLFQERKVLLWWMVSWKQLLSSTPLLTSPPSDSQQPVFISTKSLNLGNKCMKTKLEQSSWPFVVIYHQLCLQGHAILKENTALSLI